MTSVAWAPVCHCFKLSKTVIVCLSVSHVILTTLPSLLPSIKFVGSLTVNPWEKKNRHSPTNQKSNLIKMVNEVSPPYGDCSKY